jgi:hypothetical protein
MSEANLVKGDLLEILASWKEDEIENRIKSRLALACGMSYNSRVWVIPESLIVPGLPDSRIVGAIDLALRQVQ